MLRLLYHITPVILLALLSPVTSAQKIIVKGEGRVLENDPFKTKPVYELEAYRLAQNNAIENTFGSSVRSNYERLVATEMQGQSVKSYSDIRNDYTNSFPNGQWIKTISKQCQEVKDNYGNYWMTCKVSGYASKIDTSGVNFIAKTLNGTDINKDETIDFNNGESGYLYFKSASPGYLTVFYDDLKTVQRCIPYNAMTEPDLKIEANKNYIFFSAKNADYLQDKSLVNEIEFYTDKPLDYNQFYIIFSPSPLSPPFLDPSKELKGGYHSFQSMEKESFHRWLQQNRVRNKDLQVQVIGISIRNSDKD